MVVLDRLNTVLNVLLRQKNLCTEKAMSQSLKKDDCNMIAMVLGPWTTPPGQNPGISSENQNFSKPMTCKNKWSPTHVNSGIMLRVNSPSPEFWAVRKVRKSSG